jgi:hypothetical protein
MSAPLMNFLFLYLLTIELSVLLRKMAYDYPFGIFNIFLHWALSIIILDIKNEILNIVRI